MSVRPPDRVPSILEDSSRWPLLQAVREAMARLGDGRSPALLTFTSSRGGGKTTFLRAVQTDPEIQQQAAWIGTFDAARQECSEIIRTVRASLNVAPPGSNSVLIIDNLDALLRGDGEALFELEREILLELIERGDALILAASRVELLPWRENEVIYRQETRRIPLLTPTETAASLKGSGLEGVQAFRATLGHPILVAWLQSDPRLSKQDLAQRAGEYFLQDLRESETRGLGQIASLMPAFNVLALRKALNKDNDENEDLISNYMDQIHELTGQGLVQWELQIGAYRFTESAVRCLLARQFLYQEPERFYTIQGIAARYFQDEARSPAYLHQHLVSAVYHLAQSYQPLGQREAGERCLEWIEASSAYWSHANWDRILQAWKTGAGEPAVQGEMVELMGEKAYRRITQRIEKNQHNREANL